MRPSTLIPLVVGIAMAAVVIVAIGYPYFQAKLSLLFAAGLVLVLAIVQVIKELRERVKASTQTPDVQEASSNVHAKAYLRESLWLIGFVVAVYILGFVIAIPLFGIAYMIAHGVKARTSITISALWTLFCWATFTFLLDSGLYEGLILQQLGLE